MAPVSQDRPNRHRGVVRSPGDLTVPRSVLDDDLDALELLELGVARGGHRAAEGADEVHGAVGDAGGAEHDLLERPDGLEADALAAGELGVRGLAPPVEAAA